MALTLASLTFVILPSGLIAISESRLDSTMDRAVSNAFRVWVEFRGLTSATRSSPAVVCPREPVRVRA